MGRVGRAGQRIGSSAIAVHGLCRKAQLDVDATEVGEEFPIEVTFGQLSRAQTVEAVLEDLAGLGKAPLSKGEEPQRIGARRDELGIAEFLRGDASRGKGSLGFGEPAQTGERLPDAERVPRPHASVGADADRGAGCLERLQRLGKPMLTKEGLTTGKERTRLLCRRGIHIEERRQGLLQSTGKDPQGRQGRSHAVVLDHADVAGRETAPAQLHLRHPS